MSEDVKTQDGEVSTDQKDTKESEVNFDDMTPEEVSAFVEKQKAEVIKLNSIIERKGKIVKDLNERVSDVEDTPDIKKTPDLDEAKRTERLELKVDYDYPDEVIEHILALGGKEALKNPLTKKVADKMAEDIKSQSATDIPSGPQASVDRRIKVSDLKDMSVEEMEKVLPHKEI